MAHIPDGMVYEFELQDDGENVTVHESELVCCLHCVYAVPYEGADPSNPDALTCKYAFGNNVVTPSFFCKAGERVQTYS